MNRTNENETHDLLCLFGLMTKMSISHQGNKTMILSNQDRTNLIKMADFWYTISTKLQSEKYHDEIEKILDDCIELHGHDEKNEKHKEVDELMEFLKTLKENGEVVKSNFNIWTKKEKGEEKKDDKNCQVAAGLPPRPIYPIETVEYLGVAVYKLFRAIMKSSKRKKHKK